MQNIEELKEKLKHQAKHNSFRYKETEILFDETLDELIKAPRKDGCNDWLHDVRIKYNGDVFCPLCGAQLQDI